MVESMKPEYRTSGNVQLTHILGAAHSSTATPSNLSSRVEEEMTKLRDAGKKPYYIPAGASSHPLGGLGYARFAFEVAAQEKELGVFFDTIVVAAASGSSLGGMVAGFTLEAAQERADLGPGKAQPRAGPRRLIGIDVYAKGTQDKVILDCVKTAAEKIGIPTADISSGVLDRAFEVNTEYNAGTYGQVDDFTVKGMKEFAELEGILTDPVYTGKAVAGLIGMARKAEFRNSKNVLFVHTGGQTSLAAYPDVR
jgi:1-aminocyclopropane-1-carboxylate deaminase